MCCQHIPSFCSFKFTTPLHPLLSLLPLLSVLHSFVLLLLFLSLTPLVRHRQNESMSVDEALQIVEQKRAAVDTLAKQANSNKVAKKSDRDKLSDWLVKVRKAAY